MGGSPVLSGALVVWQDLFSRAELDALVVEAGMQGRDVMARLLSCGVLLFDGAGLALFAVSGAQKAPFLPENVKAFEVGLKSSTQRMISASSSANWKPAL